MQSVLTEKSKQITEFSSVFWCESVLLTTSPGTEEVCSPDQGVLCLAMSLVLPPLLNVLGFSCGFSSHICPNALCKLLPFQQLRVKAEAANFLRKEDLGWEETVLPGKPRGRTSICPRFLFPSGMLL